MSIFTYLNIQWLTHGLYNITKVLPQLLLTWSVAQSKDWRSMYCDLSSELEIWPLKKEIHRKFIQSNFYNDSAPSLFFKKKTN